MDQATVVKDDEADNIIKDIGIPPCPAILTKLMQEMRKDDPDFNKIGKLIGGDVSLAAAMLKTVNSPFYGLSTKASSVQQAIALLGLRNVSQLATGLLLRGGFSGGSNKWMEEFWESSSAIARVSAALARELKTVNRDEAYTFALFRDCGMLAMMSRFKDYKPLLAGFKRPGPGTVTSTEDTRHAINHARVGSLMAKTWLLPEEICHAVQWHHDYAELQKSSPGVPAASCKYIAIGLVAESVYVRDMTDAPGEEWEMGAEFALTTLGIAPDELDGLLAKVAGEAVAA